MLTMKILPQKTKHLVLLQGKFSAFSPTSETFFFKGLAAMDSSTVMNDDIALKLLEVVLAAQENRTNACSPMPHNMCNDHLFSF